jgi:hypothetical protein
MLFGKKAHFKVHFNIILIPEEATDVNALLSTFYVPLSLLLSYQRFLLCTGLTPLGKSAG